MREEIKKQFCEILGSEQVMIDEPMSCHTTFRIGGPAEYFVCPRTVQEVQKTIQICLENQIPYFILGNGSNLLVSDHGYQGVIIQLFKNMNQITVERDCIRAQAGALLSSIAKQALACGLAGFEFAGGIPGTLGGAVVMNAGAYGGEMKDVLDCVTVLNQERELVTIPVSEMKMGYRTSIVKEKGYTVLEAVLRLNPADEEEIREKMRDFTQRRVSKQPLDLPSAGSTFKRPEGYFAGKLIMDAGLRGYRVGGAQVSEKHCGFVVNTDHATAQDVRQLMQDVSDRVWEKFHVRLEPEVKFLGDFSTGE